MKRFEDALHEALWKEAQEQAEQRMYKAASDFDFAIITTSIWPDTNSEVHELAKAQIPNQAEAIYKKLVQALVGKAIKDSELI